ncbi:MAG TPA: hypothetical protein PK728_12405 [Bacillota bacterium]|nr:hypothetical protein [Bacillota bacterium]
MPKLLDRLLGKKQNTEPVEIKCFCGETVVSFFCEKKDIYFCNRCNKFIYYLDVPDTEPGPFSLPFFKKKGK